MNNLTFDRATTLIDPVLAETPALAESQVVENLEARVTELCFAVFDVRPDSWLVRHLASLDAKRQGHSRTAPCYRLFRSNAAEGFRVLHDLRSGSALDCELWSLPAPGVEALRTALPPSLALTPVRLVDGRVALGAITIPSLRDAELLGWWQPVCV